MQTWQTNEVDQVMLVKKTTPENKKECKNVPNQLRVLDVKNIGGRWTLPKPSAFVAAIEIDDHIGLRVDAPANSEVCAMVERVKKKLGLRKYSIMGLQGDVILPGMSGNITYPDPPLPVGTTDKPTDAQWNQAQGMVKPFLEVTTVYVFFDKGCARECDDRAACRDIGNVITDIVGPIDGVEKYEYYKYGDLGTWKWP